METEVRCLHAPRNLFSSSLKTHRVVEPHDQQYKHPLRRTLKPLNVNKMESLENILDWTRKSGTNPSPSWKITPRVRRLRSLPPGLARVPPAHFGDRKSARRGCRGRRGTRGLLQREISTGVQQFGQRHSAWSNVPLLSGVREARGSFLATQPSCPPGLEAPRPAEEQRPSCVVHSGQC